MPFFRPSSHRGSLLVLFRHIALLALPLLFLAACQNDPDSTGVGIIPNEDIVGAVRFDSQRDSARVSGDAFGVVLPAYSSTMLSIGQADGYNASTLIRWQYMADTIGWAGRIVSARIRLHSLPYHVGARVPITIDVREITSFWNSFTFTSDSLPALQLAPGLKGSSTKTLADTDSIDIPIDTSMVRSWLVKVDSGVYYQIRGVLLQTSGSGIVQAFQSAEGSHPPTLEIILEQNGKLDTLYGQNLEDTYVTTGPLPSEQHRIIMQGGAPRRGRLFFDVSAIPPSSIVNHVALYLHMDKNLSTDYYRSIDSLIVFASLDSLKNTTSSSGIVTSIDANDPTMLSAQGTLLIQAVQTWVNRRSNNGLILVKSAELSDLDRLAIYGGDAPADLRPRLVVTYTSQP